MLDIGLSELILFSIIAIIFIGPDRLPTVIRELGKYYAIAKNAILELQGIVVEDLKINELQKQINDELNRLKSTEIELRQYIKEINKEISELTKNKIKTDQQENSLNNPNLNERIIIDEDKDEK